MNLESKKKLAAKALNVGTGRIKFDESRLDEIKEAITKQDIRDLHAEGAIKLREIHGRKTKEKKKQTRRKAGKRRMKVKGGKQEYVILTRKLRRYINELREQEKIDEDKYTSLRKRIKMKHFKSKRHLKEGLK
jgi:large subunit ribosomal protein L19e